MAADAFVFIFRRPFQWREFLEQAWFVARVSMLPTLLVAIPFTTLVSFTLNILLRACRRCGRLIHGVTRPGERRHEAGQRRQGRGWKRRDPGTRHMCADHLLRLARPRLR